MLRRFIVHAIAVTMIATTMSGCALFRFGGNTPATETAGVSATEAERTAQLRLVVDRVLKSDSQARSEETAELIFRRPYYYREYVNYPDGISDYDMSIVASDSRTTPYTANIKLNKERYTTRFENKKDTARSASNFYASRGYETRSYELRHGRWREVGTLFVAEETDDTLKRLSPRFNEVKLLGTDVEEKPGFFRRLQFWRD